MLDNTRIYNRFVWWSVVDCACVHCLYYHGKKRPCSLDNCVVEDIRLEALWRDQTALLCDTTRTEVIPCPA